MKKLSVILGATLLILLSFGPPSAYSYTAYFAVDGSLDFDILTGFGITINGGTAPGDTAMVIYYQGDPAVNIGGTDYNGSVPKDLFVPPNIIIPNWDIALIGSGVDAFNDLGINNLVAGAVLSLTSATDITLDSWSLFADSILGGSYPADSYQINTDILSSTGALYTATTATVVPIPPTVLLLGAGLVGLVGIRRRVKS